MSLTDKILSSREMLEEVINKSSTTKLRSTANLIRSLKDFWVVKGMFDAMRLDPNYEHTDKFYDTLVNFLEDHTNLPAMEFWANLTRGDKIRMCTHASLVQKPHLDIVVNKDKAEAEVCVVLSGNAKLSIIGKETDESVTCHLGKSFGAIDLFNNPKRIHQQLVAVKVFVEKGSILRLWFKTLMDIICPPVVKKKIVLRRQMSDKSRLQDDGIQLSAEDLWTIRVKQVASKCVPAPIYKQMLSNRIIPTTHSDHGFEYIKQRDIGKKLSLSSENEIAMVYIVIEGAIRLQLEKAMNRISVLNFTEKGEHPMKIKTQRYPLILLEAGSVLTVKPELFKVGYVAPVIEEKEVEMAQKLAASGGISDSSSIASESVNSLHADALGNEKSSMDGRELNTKKKIPPRHLSRALIAAERTKNIGREEQRVLGNERSAYTLSMVFDKPTVYLEIPYLMFKMKVKDVSLKMFKRVDWHLNHTRKTIMTRIEGLLPWIRGDIEIDTAVRKITRQSRRFYHVEALTSRSHSKHSLFLKKDDKDKDNEYVDDYDPKKEYKFEDFSIEHTLDMLRSDLKGTFYDDTIFHLDQSSFNPDQDHEDHEAREGGPPELYEIDKELVDHSESKEMTKASPPTPQFTNHPIPGAGSNTHPLIAVKMMSNIFTRSQLDSMLDSDDLSIVSDGVSVVSSRDNG